MAHGPADAEDRKPPRKNYTWAQLMARTFEFDVLHCQIWVIDAKNLARSSASAEATRIYLDLLNLPSALPLRIDAVQCNALQCIVMEDQLTVRFPRELNKALKEKAARMKRKPSEVVRIAVAEFLQISVEPSESPGGRVKHLIGSVETGIPDLALRHREYVLKKLRRGH